MDTSEELRDGHDGETRKPLLDPIQEPLPKIKPSISKELLEKMPSETNTPPPNDICVELMGNWGKWQMKSVSMIYLSKIPAAWLMACIIFTAPFPWYEDYQCDVSKYENNSNWSLVTHPKVITADGSYQYDYCQVILESNQSDVPKESVVPCDSFKFNLDIYTTLITQFDLVCSRNILVAITQSFHLFGVLLGGIFSNELMVYYSPKVVMMIGILTMVPFGLATGFAPWFWVHVACRCLVAACCAMIFTPGSAIFSDITNDRPKTIVSANFEHFWSVGVILLPAIGYFTNNWLQIYLTITSSAVVFFVMWFFIPDSPRWHLERGNVEKAQSILESAARCNGLEKYITEDLSRRLKDQSDNIIEKIKNLESKNNWKHLISLPKSIRMILLSFISWGLMLTCYYGTLLNIRSFGREYLYMNTAIAGSCEIIGVFIGFIAIMFSGNYKWQIIGAFSALTGLINCFIWLLPSYVDGSHYLLDLLLISMLNKIGISACLCILTTCTAELFPIPHKKRIMYASTVVGRIVFLTAPLIGATVKFGDGVPLTFFGVLTTIGGLCAFMMESVNSISKVENLPKTIFIVENKH